MELKKLAATGLFIFCGGGLAMAGMRVVDLIIPMPEITYMVCLKSADQKTHCDEFIPSPS